MRDGVGRLALVTTFFLYAGACDVGDGRTPRDPAATQAFESALDELAGYEGIALVFTLESTVEDLAKLDEGDEILDADAAAEILDSSLTIVANDTAPEAATEIVLNAGGNEDAAELRIVDGSLFVRADVPELFEMLGGDPGRLRAAVDRASRTGLDFLAPAFEGDWLGIAGVDRLAEQFGGPPPAPAGDRTAAERLATILRAGPGATSEGTDEIGDRLSVALPMRDSAQDFAAVLQQLAGPVGAIPLPDASGLPEGDITLDAWIRDGRLVQLELDLLGIGDLVGEEPPDGVKRYALRMGLEELTSDVAAPEGATMVAPGQVLEAFFML